MRRLLLIPLVVALLGACGGGSSGDNEISAGAVVGHNDADVTFVQGMIPHHRQAVEMAQMGLEKATRPEVKTLAQKIVDAQQPEIDKLTGWLRDWGLTEQPIAGGMGGMMSSSDMDALKAASGPDFHRLFLELMIKHHKGAISMAEAEVKDGQHGGAIQMAKMIIEDQQAEIAEMQSLLQGLSGGATSTPLPRTL